MDMPLIGENNLVGKYLVPFRKPQQLFFNRLDIPWRIGFYIKALFSWILLYVLFVGNPYDLFVLNKLFYLPFLFCLGLGSLDKNDNLVILLRSMPFSICLGFLMPAVSRYLFMPSLKVWYESL